MKRTGREHGEDDRVSVLKRLSEDELVTYVDRVLEHHGSIDPGSGSLAAHECDTCRVKPPAR